MKQYHQLLQHIIDNGHERDDRTGVGTISVFGYQTRYDISEGFPLVTTKKLHLRSIIHELLWFLKGDTHVQYLQDNKVRIWNEWATKEQCARFGRQEGDLGPIYGHQWRNFGGTPQNDGTFAKNGFDQIQYVLDEIKTNPQSRRLIVSGWNPQQANQVALPPCHTLFQFYVDVKRERLNCQLYQRSADSFLGVPFNIASYSLLTMMIAQVTGLKPGDFVHSFGDLHLYKNHLDQAREQLSREPKPLPQMKLNPEVKSLFDFTIDDFTLEGYDPHPHIKAEVAV